MHEGCRSCIPIVRIAFFQHLELRPTGESDVGVFHLPGGLAARQAATYFHHAGYVLLSRFCGVARLTEFVDGTLRGVTGFHGFAFLPKRAAVFAPFSP